MTFGYNAAIFDKTALGGPEIWAGSLLTTLSALRVQSGSSTRPLILVCHSLGGLLARRAITMLQSAPKRYQGITLSKCALLFLSTPNSGTTISDWSPLVRSLLQSVTGYRDDIVARQLKSFNDDSVNNKWEFEHMNQRPLFKCLCEGQKTKFPGLFGSRSLLVRSSSIGNRAGKSLTLCRL